MTQHPRSRPESQPDRVAYRQVRVQRSLNMLRAHPAVNPSIPFPALSSPEMQLIIRPPLQIRTSPRGIVVNNEFKKLVRRELGIDPEPSRLSPIVDQYLLASRAVVSRPRLKNPNFLARITSSYGSVIADANLVKQVVKHPLKGGPLSTERSRAREINQIHKQLTMARVKREEKRQLAQAEAMAKAKSRREEPPQPIEECNSTPRLRKRLLSDASPSKTPLKKARSAELADFRPTAESVRLTRSAARRARRNSASSTPSECCFCPDPDLFDGKEIDSELIGPFVNRKGLAKLFVHFDCACWAPQVYTDPATGNLKRVFDEHCRGRQLYCSSCNERGATIGCYIQRCKRVFHFRCLMKAKAYTVERFFAAFCGNHAHLGKQKSYKILMEAATIADVSAAQRREDTTYGLDAPHSRYTLLRRRETEVIFSTKWRVSSHYTATDDTTVVFSHRRRQVVKKSERLKKEDGIRVLRLSAIDVASGKLAYMALAEKSAMTDDMTAVEARAAIASRESTGLFLLRNLRGSRKWQAGDIKTVKSIPFHVAKRAEEARKLKETPEVDQAAGKKEEFEGKPKESDQPKSLDEKDIAPEESQHDGAPNSISKSPARSLQAKDETNPSGSPKLPQRRPRGRSRKGSTQSMSSGPSDNDKFPKNVRSSDDGSKSDVNDVDKKEPSSSLKLPQRRPRGRPRKGSTQSMSSGPSDNDKPSQNNRSPADAPISDVNDIDKPPFPPPKLTPAKRPLPVASEKSNRVLEKETGKSAWRVFLEEELPKERQLRPEDSVSDSLRNMARLWSMMTIRQRNVYEQKAQSSQTSEKENAAGTKPTDVSPVVHKSVGQGSSRRTDIGFFSLGDKRRKTGDIQAGQAQRRNIGSSREASASLPSRRMFASRKENPDWDEMFPTSLEPETEIIASIGDEEDAPHRVRKPPSSFR